MMSTKPDHSRCLIATDRHNNHMLNLPLARLMFASVLIVCFGCAGEDFSAPPPNLADIRAKAKSKQPDQNDQPAQQTSQTPTPTKPKSDESVADEATSSPPGSDIAAAIKQTSGTAEQQSTDIAAAEPDAAQPAIAENSGGDSTSLITEPSAATATTVTESDADKSSAAADSRQPSPRDKVATAAVEGETVTAGGKTEDQLNKDQNSKDSPGTAGMSLLEKLKAGNDDSESQQQAKGQRRSPREVIQRTGRFAIAAQTWLKLRNDLARRFYFATTENASRIAATSGQRSLGVLSTQIEILGEELQWSRQQRTVAAVRQQKQQVVTQPVTGLPGRISCIELLEDGNLIVVGTDDGRLICRSCANLQNWDVYARDLFQFQDEQRAATRVAETAVFAVRAIDEERLLTVTADNTCQIWKTSDVIHPPASPLKMTEDQVRSPDAQVLNSTPEHSFNIPESRLLNIFFSTDRSLGGLITSDEQVVVFDTASGRISETITAAQLDDTQPVAAFFEQPEGRIVVGLADGRVLRRAISGAEPVQSTDDKGIAVDYEVIFAPDTGDRAGAITALERNADGTVMYAGRLDGSVSEFDLPRKELLRTSRPHRGSVIDIRATDAGVFTIGNDRSAKLSYRISTSRPKGGMETFNLPQDAALSQLQLVEGDEETIQDKFTIRRNFDGDVTDAQSNLDLVGIRPADPVLALYEHQLRVASDEKLRANIRTKIAKLKPEDSQTIDQPEQASDQPIQIAEFNTEFDYLSRPLRRVVMSISSDGSTLAAAQFYKKGLMRGAAPDQPVMVWDTISGTRLRTWKRSSGVSNLELNMATGMVLPTPLSGRMDLFTGAFVTQEQEAFAAQQSYTGQDIAMGMQGLPGTASNVLGMFSPQSGETRHGLEAFEGIVPSLAWAPSSTSLYVSLREKTQWRLLELDSNTLAPLSTIDQQPMTGTWNLQNVDIRNSMVGATHVLPSPGDKYLVAYGRFGSGNSQYQMKIWKRSRTGWPKEDVQVIESGQALIDSEMTDTPMVFVNQQDTFLAIIGMKGIGIVNLRTGDVDQTQELPDVDGRRPVTLLSPDGKWLLAADREGNVWIWSLRSLERKPQKFAAQAGPVAGLAMSVDGRYLATAGQENRIRIWDMTSLTQPVQSASRN